MVVSFAIPVPVILSETITLTASAAVSCTAVDPLVMVVAVIWKVSRPIYRSSLYSVNDDTAPRLSSVLFTVASVTEVRVCVPEPVFVMSTTDPSFAADKVSVLAAGVAST